MEKSIEAAKTLLDEIASNNYYWLSERATPKRSRGNHEVNVLTLLVSKVNTLAQILEVLVLLLL